MIRIRATHKLHNIVFKVKEEAQFWSVIHDCLQRMHIHYGLILKNVKGLKIEIVEISEGEPSDPKRADSVKGP